MMGVAKQIHTLLCRLEEGLIIILLLAMMGLSCVQIFLRYVLDGGLQWVDPLLRQMLLWSGLLGAVVTTRKGKHIAMDIVSHLLPPYAKPWLALINNLFSGLVCLVLAYSAVTFVRNEFAFSGDRTLLGMPGWVINIIFPLSFGLMALHFLARVLDIFLGFWRSPTRIEENLL